jgi:hypothetical protein
VVHQRPSDGRVTVNKPSVEVGEPEKDLNVFVALRLWLFANSFHTYRVYYNALWGNDKP